MFKYLSTRAFWQLARSDLFTAVIDKGDDPTLVYASYHQRQKFGVP